jgi:hypothetical protein
MTRSLGRFSGFGPQTARTFLAIFAAVAMVWAIAVFPTFSSEIPVVAVSKAVAAGEAFKPGVLAALDARVESDAGFNVRSAVLGHVAIIRLRQTEEAIRLGDAGVIDRDIKSLSSALDATLQNAPSESFLWLARFWLKNYAEGFKSDHLADLRMSYATAPYEGWIVAKRNYIALSYYSTLPDDLRQIAVAEFVNLVRWGLFREAAEITAGPGRPLRNILFPPLKDLKIDERRPFAQAIYGRDLDDVLVPGIALPSPQIPMPVLPPGF